MAHKKVRIGLKEYNKTTFSARWSEIVHSTECNFFVRGDDRDFVLLVMDLIPTFAKIKARARQAATAVEFKIRNKKFQGRAVRGIVIISPNSKTEVWVGKARVLAELFPSKKALPEHRQNRNDALAALRQIIEPQIALFRLSMRRQLKRGKAVRCSITNEPIFSEFHVDHALPFSVLVEQWCREEKVDLEKIHVQKRGTKCRLTSTAVAESWFDFHLLNANLQVSTPAANIKKSNKIL